MGFGGLRAATVQQSVPAAVKNTQSSRGMMSAQATMYCRLGP